MQQTRGEWPYLWLGATYFKQHEGERIVSVAAIIALGRLRRPPLRGDRFAMAVNTEGKREIVGLHIDPNEAETFWSTFLKSVVKRGLRGVKLVISDAPEGLKAAIRRVMGATWQRCSVHRLRNALACVSKGQQTMVAPALRQAFPQPDQAAARQTWRHVAAPPDLIRGSAAASPSSARSWTSEHDVLACMGLPIQHRAKLRSTNTPERSNNEVKRRADVVGIFPGASSLVRLIGAVLLLSLIEGEIEPDNTQVTPKAA